MSGQNPVDTIRRILDTHPVGPIANHVGLAQRVIPEQWNITNTAWFGHAAVRVDWTGPTIIIDGDTYRGGTSPKKLHDALSRIGDIVRDATNGAFTVHITSNTPRRDKRGTCLYLIPTRPRTQK